MDSDIEGSAKRWKKFVESETPEKEVFPKEWKNKTALQKLCMMRCMRPDRMTYAVKYVLHPFRNLKRLGFSHSGVKITLSYSVTGNRNA